MNDWAIAELEMEFRTKTIEDELQRARLAELTKATRSEDERLRVLRRAETGLGDMIARLTCQLQNRLAPGIDAAAC